MDNIIDKLLEIDHSAREMVENASKQRESSIANLAAVKKEINMTAMNDAHAKAEEYRKQVKADTEKLKNAYAAEYEKNRSALESTYNGSCSSWVDAIVKNCTRVN